MVVKDVFEFRDHLGSKLLLLQVVAGLHDTADEAKVLLSCHLEKVRFLRDFRVYLLVGLLTEETMGLGCWLQGFGLGGLGEDTETIETVADLGFFLRAAFIAAFVR